MDKPRRSKSREVSSRFLPPTPPADLHPPPSPNQTISPHRHKSISSTDSRTEKHHHHRSTPAFIRGIWPSATPTPTSTTLADYLGKDKRKDNIKTSDNNNNSNKENRFENPSKFKLTRSSTSSPFDRHVIPGRLSVDENALRQKSFSRRSDCPEIRESTIKNVMKRRTESPLSSFLSSGLDLIRGKKSGSSGVHQLRMMNNRLVQWRFVNARAEFVNKSISNRAERNLVSATDSITKLRRFVLQKKLQLMKQKLEMKLNFIARSQIKLLEAWGDLERQHLAAVSTTKDALHSVVCRVPLIEGAKVEPQSASIALRHASDLTASIKSMLSTFSPTAEEAVLLLSELAEVATQEKSLLEECLEYFRALSTLEMQEWSLKCTIMQIQLAQQQQQQQKLEIPA